MTKRCRSCGTRTSRKVWRWPRLPAPRKCGRGAATFPRSISWAAPLWERARRTRWSTATARPTRSPISMSQDLAFLRPAVRPTRLTRSSRCRCAAPSSSRPTGGRSRDEALLPSPRKSGERETLLHSWNSPCLDARQQLERIPALYGLQIGRAETPIGNARVDFGAVAERIVGAVHHLRDRHHLQQRRDLARRVALGELVIELPELGEGPVRQVRRLALLRQADEAAGQER